jgi:hypothetical protein
MKVYSLECEFSPKKIGLFSSKEKAEEYIEVYKTIRDEFPLNQHVKILEIELDEKIKEIKEEANEPENLFWKKLREGSLYLCIASYSRNWQFQKLEIENELEIHNKQSFFTIFKNNGMEISEGKRHKYYFFVDDLNLSKQVAMDKMKEMQLKKEDK